MGGHQPIKMLHSSLKVLRPIVASHIVMPSVVSANIPQTDHLCPLVCCFKLIFGKKSNSSEVRMGLFSMLGIFLLAWFFMVSAIQSSFMFENHERVREDYAAKLSGVVDFLERYLELTSSGKVNLIFEFVMMFNILKISGGLLFLRNEMILNMCGTYMLMFYFLIATPIVYDFYLYKVGDPEFLLLLLHGFMQNMALFGALLFLKQMKLTK